VAKLPAAWGEPKPVGARFRKIRLIRFMTNWAEISDFFFTYLTCIESICIFYHGTHGEAVRDSTRPVGKVGCMTLYSDKGHKEIRIKWPGGSLENFRLPRNVEWLFYFPDNRSHRRALSLVASEQTPKSPPKNNPTNLMSGQWRHTQCMTNLRRKQLT
jgi:hypothetical protein